VPDEEAHPNTGIIGIVTVPTEQGEIVPILTHVNTSFAFAPNPYAEAMPEYTITSSPHPLSVISAKRGVGAWLLWDKQNQGFLVEVPYDCSEFAEDMYTELPAATKTQFRFQRRYQWFIFATQLHIVQQLLLKHFGAYAVDETNMPPNWIAAANAPLFQTKHQQRIELGQRVLVKPEEE
jgi:hypothetical protein